ncbi:MAG: energy transducer TonB [Paracoccus sp. (in: a-proteobacteria)]
MTGGDFGDALKWGALGLLVLAGHAAGGIWLDSAIRRGAASNLPAPVVVEMFIPAPEELAAGPETAENAPPEDMQPEPEALTEPEAEPAPEPELADYEVPPLTQLPPVTDFAELLPDSALILTVSDRPRERPLRETRREEPRKNTPERKETRKAEPKREKAKTDAQPRSTASSQKAAPSDKGSSQGGGNPGVSKKQMASWSSTVGSRIIRHMSRTRINGGGRGKISVQLSISVSPGGAVSGRLASSTGIASVDQALARQAGRLPSVPPPPDGKSASFVLPISISLR